MQTKLLVATSKGLVILTKENAIWKIVAVHFTGLPISLAYVDERDPTWWIGISHRHWGEKLHYSKDEGKTWHEAGIPSYKNFYYRPHQPATLKKLWVMQHAGADQPGCLWLGTEPGGLFFSKDHGNSWALTESLWNHPSRLNDNQWFGAGKDFPFIHSILVDPRDSNCVYIGVSCAGVFKTTDGGITWHAKNSGLVASYLPNPTAEVGHDPHRMMLCTSNPDVIWQQSHCGIFKTLNAAENWIAVNGEDGFPSYGFALVIDESDCQKAWVIPAQSDEIRLPHELKLTVCKTINGGKSWMAVNNGLPTSNCFDLVLRQAFAKRKETFAFGTNNGNLFISEDDGENWTAITHQLATINCLTFS